MPHLVLVDDDEEILSLLTGFFRKHAHNISVATNGSAMFEALEKESIDLVILDVMLRDEDGFRLCRRLRHKLEVGPKDPELIRTVRNGGYVFAPTVTRE